MSAVFEDLRLALADSWESWKSLPHQLQRAVLAGIAGIIAIFFVAWWLALALSIFAIGVVLYLRSSKDKGAL